jgi:hypothetical protein
MALLAEVETIHGEKRKLYIRLNNVEASNHGVPCRALFRGFLSEQAFKEGKHFLWEEYIEFKGDATGKHWDQAYTALSEKVKGEKV